MIGNSPKSLNYKSKNKKKQCIQIIQIVIVIFFSYK